MAAKSNNWFNILISYAYLGGSDNFTDISMNLANDNRMDLMVDSGAFTLHHAKGDRSWLTVDSYSDFIIKYHKPIKKYVSLDVINNHAGSIANYERMLERGLNPMYVAIPHDDDYEYILQAIENNPDICISGGTVTKGDWMKKRFQTIYEKSGQKARIHGLGYVTFPDIFRLNLASVDSSSWLSPLRYGNMVYFDKGPKTLGYKEVLTRQKKLPIKIIKLLEQIKVTPKMFSDLENHKGNKGIGFVLSSIAYMEYQQYAKRQGVELYLALASQNALENLIYIKENWEAGTLTYDGFKKFKKLK